MIKINNKILSIPPFISTSWTSVKSLHVNDDVLFVHLNDGAIVQIPKLEEETIHSIFHIHSEIMEKVSQKPLMPLLPNPFLQPHKEPHLKFAIGNMEELHAHSQHNPELSDSPPIPAEILQKIVNITKMIAPQDSFSMSPPEPNCNCVHCQISKAFGNSSEKNENTIVVEEVVSDSDLHFQEWNILQESEQLYTVTHKLNEKEKFNVFLGDPVGCTCGKKGCEHLVAVLKS